MPFACNTLDETVNKDNALVEVFYSELYFSNKNEVQVLWQYAIKCSNVIASNSGRELLEQRSLNAIWLEIRCYSAKRSVLKLPMNQTVCLLIISNMVIVWLPWHTVNMPGQTV